MGLRGPTAFHGCRMSDHSGVFLSLIPDLAEGPEL